VLHGLDWVHAVNGVYGGKPSSPSVLRDISGAPDLASLVPGSSEAHEDAEGQQQQKRKLLEAAEGRM